MSRVAMYVNGFNLYHAIDKLGHPHLKWLNLYKLAESFLHDDETLVRVAYFSAHVTWSKDKRQRHVNYIKALGAVGVDTQIYGFEKRHKYCREFDRYCRFDEEKQTDVALAVSLVGDAHSDFFDWAILVTADSDQVPAIAHLKSLNPPKSLLLAAPPGRLQQARKLGSLADERIEISPGRLGTCLLPRNVKNDTGKTVAYGPATYAPPYGWGGD